MAQKLIQYQQLAYVPLVSLPLAFSQSSAQVAYQPLYQYQAQAYVPLTNLPNPLAAPLQVAAENQVNQPVFRQPNLNHLYPSFSIDALQLTQRERTTPDKWTGYRPDRIDDVRRTQYLWAGQAPMDPFQLTQKERTTPDKWLGYRPDVLFDLRRQQYSYPSSFPGALTIGTPAAFVQSAVQPQSQPVLDLRRIQYSYPSMAPIDTRQLTLKERTSPDRYIGYRPDRVWDADRRQYAYPFVYDSLAAALPKPPAPALSWKPTYLDFIWRAPRTDAAVYPYLSIGYPYYSPNGCDCFPATAWVTADRSYTTPWTENAARDATRVSYDQHIPYDQHVWYDGVDPSLVTWPNTSWTPDSPPSTTWTCC